MQIALGLQGHVNDTLAQIEESWTLERLLKTNLRLVKDLQQKAKARKAATGRGR